MKNIGRHLLKKGRTEYQEYGLNSFWTKCLKVFAGPLQLTATKAASEKQASEKVIKERPAAVQLKQDIKKELSQGLEVPVQTSEKPVLPQGIIKGASPRQDIPGLLEKLAQGISDISSELSAIRVILEKGSMNSGIK